MRLSEFEFVEPKTIKEALRRLTRHGGFVLIAGGSDLLVNMKHGVVRPRSLIYMKDLRKLAYIIKGEKELRVGGLTTLDELASSPLIREKCLALGHAAGGVGAYVLQNKETLWGNLCQENRCPFYNQSFLLGSIRPVCYKAGGEVCHAAQKAGECRATYCSDLATVLIAVDAQVNLVGPSGERVLPVEKLYTQDGRMPLSIEEGEILREVRLPYHSGMVLYRKWKLGNGLESPAVSLTLRVDWKRDGRIDQSKIVFSGVAPGPVEALESERMLQDAVLDCSLTWEAARKAVKETFPAQTSIHSPAYKRKMARVLLKRALEEIKTIPHQSEARKTVKRRPPSRFRRG
jgi:4-hydroxybenzoyl-CoA reductase beta subunit